MDWTSQQVGQAALQELIETNRENRSLRKDLATQLFNETQAREVAVRALTDQIQVLQAMINQTRNGAFAI